MSAEIDRTIRATLTAVGFAVALACGVSSPSTDADASTGALGCEHGTVSACACPDGSMGTQLCAHDSSGFEPCMCGGDGDVTDGEVTDGGVATTVMPGSGDDGTEASGGAASSSGESSVGDTTAVDDSGGSSSSGVVGLPPAATINHPGTEDRQAGVPIPFIGVADDPEDGALSGLSLQWTDDLEGMIGTGLQFDAALDVLGEHTVTLTATDADGNVDAATVTFTIVP